MDPAYSIVQPNTQGVFIRRSSISSGDVATSGIQLRWPYATNLKSDTVGDFISAADQVEIEIHALEMVYVPQGSFDVGDGKVIVSNSQSAEILTVGNLHRADSATTPYTITSENAITLGGMSSNAMCSTSSVASRHPNDDFNSTTQQNLPAAFPKGYNGFYTMKYEVTQEQYVEFLNSLRREQQLNRVRTVDPALFSMSNLPTTIVPTHSRVVIRAAAAPDSFSPYTFYCDHNLNGAGGDIDDGQNLAVTFLERNDVAAYLDWACLRPMTELEYEKACRGPLPAVAGEFAWGTTNVSFFPGDVLISTFGRHDEKPYMPETNMSGTVAVGSTTMPHRVGMYVRSSDNSSREMAGATFYGAMDMAGNAGESLISLSTAQGRTYTGIHGDGKLDSIGFADVTNWPAQTGEGWGRKGICLENPYADYGFQVSTRDWFIQEIDIYTSKNRGMRGVVTYSTSGGQP